MNTEPLCIPIHEAAAKDPNVQRLLDDLSSGKACLCSPFDGMDVPWTDAETTALTAALTKLRDRKMV